MNLLNTALRAALTVAAASLACLAVTSVASDASGPCRGPNYVYETLQEFVPAIGLRRCHYLSFPCATGQYEISQHFLFGKTNEKEIKFRSGLCHPSTLLCVESAYNWQSRMLTIVLAETEDQESWPDTIVDKLQPKKAIDEFLTPAAYEYVHTEWDELTYWGYEEDERKADFLGWISIHAR